MWGEKMGYESDRRRYDVWLDNNMIHEIELYMLDHKVDNIYDAIRSLLEIGLHKEYVSSHCFCKQYNDEHLMLAPLAHHLNHSQIHEVLDHCKKRYGILTADSESFIDTSPAPHDTGEALN